MNSNDTIFNRLEWLDVAKGITIILMVLGHTSIPDILSRFIWAFHMPLFFVASGITTNWTKYNFMEFCSHKCKKLLIPFFVYSVIVLIISLLIGKIELRQWLIYGWQGYALWFIPVLLVALIIAKLVMMIPNEIFRFFVVLQLIALGWCFDYWNLKFPWTLGTIPYATFLVLSGTILKKYIYYFDKPNVILLIGSLGVTMIISHFFRLDMAWNKITPISLLTIGAYAGITMIFTLSSYITKYTKYTSFITQVIGQETFIIVAFSQIIIITINYYFLLNIVVKYILLIIILVIIKYAKDCINKLIGSNVL